jgi:hypothetical protein
MNRFRMGPHVALLVHSLFSITFSSRWRAGVSNSAEGLGLKARRIGPWSSSHTGPCWKRTRDALLGITARPGCTNQPPQPLSAPGPQCGSWPSRHSFRPRDGCPNNFGTTRNSERLDACLLNRQPLLEHGLLRFPQGICTRWPHRKSEVHCQIQ